MEVVVNIDIFGIYFVLREIYFMVVCDVVNFFYGFDGVVYIFV